MEQENKQEHTKNEYPAQNTIVQDFLKKHIMDIVICVSAGAVVFAFGLNGAFNSENRSGDVYYHENSSAFSVAESDLSECDTELDKVSDTVNSINDSTNNSSVKTVVTTNSAPSTTAITNASPSEITTQTVVKTVNFPLDVNLAEFDELIQINGIGETLAQKIIDFRTSHGKITSLEQLAEIDGIGEKTVNLLHEYLYVNDSDYMPYSTEEQEALPAYEEQNTADDEPQTDVQTETAVPDDPISDTDEQTEQTEPQYTTVKINYANAEEISSALLLPIETAQEIVEIREQILYYSTVYELQFVKSLSSEDLRNIADFIDFEHN